MVLEVRPNLFSSLLGAIVLNSGLGSASCIGVGMRNSIIQYFSKSTFDYSLELFM